MNAHSNLSKSLCILAQASKFTRVSMAPYAQCYRKSWESLPELKEWLRPVEKDKKKAYCLFCKFEINSKLSDLKRHVETRKHVKAAQPFCNVRQMKLSFPRKNTRPSLATSEAEARLALLVAEKCSFDTTDDITEFCKKAFHDSEVAANLKIKQMKCRDIVVNVLSHQFMRDLRTDIGNEKFSLIIDESTDISDSKLLGFVIRYYSDTMKKIVSTFLGLVEIESSTAIAMLQAIKELLTELKLSPKNLIGVGVDNASVNTGATGGLCELLKREFALRHLVMVRCVCHSVQLAVSCATRDTLPRNIEYLVKETYNWFSHSSKRQIAYKNIYNTINEGEQPLQITRSCDTRWLSVEPAVTRILNQWDELKLQFSISRNSEKCFYAEMLYQMYSDPVNKLYLLFLRPVLRDVQAVVKAYQSEQCDPTKLINGLVNLVKVISRKVTLPSARVDPLIAPISDYIDPKPYLGYEFEKLCSEAELHTDEERNVRDRCTSFIVKLTHELRERLPDNFKILKEMSVFAVENCTNQVKEPITKLAECFGYKPCEIEVIENQWRNLSVIKWNNLTETTKFWAEVREYTDSSGAKPFKELSTLAVSLLSLPHSSAEVERLFSQVNLLKTKLRNRLCTKTVRALLTVRSGLKRLGKSSSTYEFSSYVLKAIGTNTAYSDSFQDEPQPGCSYQDDFEDDL